MYKGILHLHSYLPYLLFVGLIVSSLVFLVKLAGNKEFKPLDKTLALITLILAHLQFVAGLILYFISPVAQAARNAEDMMADPTHRLYAVEHITVMIIAVVLITIGYSRAKRQDSAKGKFKNLGLFYLLGLLVALSRIPWDAWLAS